MKKFNNNTKILLIEVIQPGNARAIQVEAHKDDDTEYTKEEVINWLTAIFDKDFSFPQKECIVEINPIVRPKYSTRIMIHKGMNQGFHQNKKYIGQISLYNVEFDWVIETLEKEIEG
jgi:hypothetical protein